jgi:hypothetical protein
VSAYSVATLPQGAFYVGVDYGGTTLGKAEDYNTATNTWTVDPLPYAAADFPALTSLADGRILLSGGMTKQDSSVGFNNAAIFGCKLNSDCGTSGTCVFGTGTVGSCHKPCSSDTDCSGSLPACNTTSGACVQCTATNKTQCVGTKPNCDTGNSVCVAGPTGCATDADCASDSHGTVCDVAKATCGTCNATNTAGCTGTKPFCDVALANDACVGCNGDDGSGATYACAASTPFCAASGACGKCASATDCATGHAGPYCNTTTGVCSNTCTTDAECGAGKWCNNVTAAGTCQATLPNGTPVTGGSCATSSAGTRACASGACDAADNACGLANGDGACTAANGATICRSAVCDPDLKCGYADSDGPCSAANQATVCRSGACSTNLTCEPAGGCNVDGDCSGGNWCSISTHTCAAKVANGGTIPTDGPHTSPTLNGTCSAGAATLTCASGVCDTADDKCGYASGDGPCSTANAATACRSGVCSVGLTCMPAGGCNVDGDCSGGNWCSISTHTCAAKVANGGTIPTDAPHTSPTLNGTCSAGAATLTCASGVCDIADNKCGYANSDGPCSTANAATACRSGVCSVGLTCMPAGGCNVDGDCSGGNWCSISTHTCAAKVANGTTVPTDAPHTSPTLNGTCSAGAATLTCASGVCDTADDKCGYANSDGPCSTANAATVCRSGACSVGLTCMPTGGCNVDGDCSGGSWCRISTHSCAAKVANGTTVPTDAPHTSPTLNGTCSAGAATLTCASGVCDIADDKCGYANSDGPCSTANAATVCRSGACSVGLTCMPTGGCNVDGDCSGGNWCSISTHTCTAKVPNGTTIPTDALHTSPTLNGTCSTAAAALTCLSGVCDTADDKCGYANSDGPCTVANGATICRSGACSANGKCLIAGSCNLDADCAGGKWCNETSHTCTPKLANGGAMPTDSPHASPTLDGTCATTAATLVCVSGVCDTTDSSCGFANGDGPCNAANGATVCRSGLCSAALTCIAVGSCNLDADCATGTWCNETAHACVPVLANGVGMPKDAPHAGPTLDGKCSGAASALVCASSVCDPTDDACGYANGDGSCTTGNAVVICRSGVCDADRKCGYVNGDGPCTDTNGARVCRSTHCTTTGANAGKCEQCNADADCSAPTSVCDTSKNVCVQCTTSRAAACTGATPVCDGASKSCVACTGDYGETTAKEACALSAPFCTTSGTAAGQCGKCTSNADCAGHPLGPICDAPSGACGLACKVDGDCASSQWCNAATGGSGSCVPKLANGTPLPASPATVATCSDTVGARVCISGACDPTDNKCGFANGDGPCKGTASLCRSNVCDKDGSCGYANGDGPCGSVDECRSSKCSTTKVCVECASDAECPASKYCGPTGACTTKGANGTPCTQPSQCGSKVCGTDGLCGSVDGSTCSDASSCRSGTCTNGVCVTPPPASDGGLVEGGGVSCSASPNGAGSTSGLAVGLGMLLMACVSRARRNRQHGDDGRKS